jgi:hypothetical protein
MRHAPPLGLSPLLPAELWRRRHRPDARLLHQHVGHVLEHLGIECVTDGLRLRQGRTHRLGALLELDSNSLAVDRSLVSIPGEAFDTHLGDVAAEAAVPVDERGPRAGPCGREGGRKPPRAATDHQNVGFQHNIDRAGRFRDLLHFG